MNKFEKGQIVILKSDSTIKGAVVDIVQDEIENKYIVFTGSGIQNFYESQLETESIDKEVKEVNLESFNANITASLIRNPSLSSLYSLNTAKIDFIPHQFRPVLKFIQLDRPRMLVADGVGVGKTIEAGLILKELQARRSLESILVVCPRPLVSENKWENEMKRFGEDFTALDGKTFRHCINELDIEEEWPEKYKKAIVPYSLFDEANIMGSEKNKGLLDVEPPKFDLVIVDEAHHIRNTSTFAYKAVSHFCDNAEAVILLTATPVQLHYDDLFVLMNLLRPDLIIDKNTFYNMAEPNDYINKAASIVRKFEQNWKDNALEQILEAKSTVWGSKIFEDNPTYLRIIELLNKDEINEEERVELIGKIESLHSFSNIISRTRRRDIGEFTIRKPYTITIDFTPYQRELHDKVLTLINDMMTIIHGTENNKFLMSTIRRQTASCLFGLAPMLNKILYKHYDELIEEGMDEEVLSQFSSNESIRSKITEILELVKNLPDDDPKYDAMLKIVENKIHEPNNKVMIFSSFRHTLYYLERKLKESGIRVGLIHGDVPDEDRRALRKRFNPYETSSSDKDAIDVLLFSEVGCEGLDYQFCDCMINYDLPWNPMKVEQRIGRIDRNGQKSESVTIYNMITPDTVDADIYERCLMRIGVFHSSIGDCEKILGEITSELNKLINNTELSSEELREKIQQISDNKIRLAKEQEELEEKQKNLFGIQVPGSSFDSELKKATNYWLSGTMIQNLVYSYLCEKLGEEKEYFIGTKELKKLRLSLDSRVALSDDLKQKNYPKNDAYKRFRKWLESNDQMLDITFDSECWKNNPDATLLSITHPLVKMAAEYYSSTNRIVTTLSVRSNDIPEGKYAFAIYEWKYLGIQEDLQLIPISTDISLNNKIFELLKVSTNVKGFSGKSEEFNKIDNAHHELWKEALEQHKQKTEELIRYKETSLQISHAARMAALYEQLEKSNEKTYNKLTQGKINNAQYDYDYHFALLEEARKKSDILSEPLAYGELIITN